MRNRLVIGTLLIACVIAALFLFPRGGDDSTADESSPAAVATTTLTATPDLTESASSSPTNRAGEARESGAREPQDSDNAGSTDPALPDAEAESGVPLSARNIILIIGDGMGPNHVEAAQRLLHPGGALSFQDFSVHTTMTHQNADGEVTDSAASATAMATGVLVHNRVIAMQIPGSGVPLDSVVDVFRRAGMALGLVTTSYLTDATPASFGAHAAHRDDDAIIADSYLTGTRPDVLLGEATDGLDRDAAVSAGYEVVDSREGLLAATSGTNPLAGLFSRFVPPGSEGRDPGSPTLAEMTDVALQRLDDDPDGFFLLVEHEGTDTYSHQNRAVDMINSMAELDEAVTIIEAWVLDHPDTLVILTADHETGGLELLEGEPLTLEHLTWSTGGHTPTPVDVFAMGPGAELVGSNVTSNADLFDVLVGARGVPGE